jgi:hypothetical protein
MLCVSGVERRGAAFGQAGSTATPHNAYGRVNVSFLYFFISLFIYLWCVARVPAGGRAQVGVLKTHQLGTNQQTHIPVSTDS